MRRELGLTYIFVSHNLGVIRYISDRVAVMHRGRVVETGTAEQIFTRPRDPYTQALLDAVPDADPERILERRTARAPAPRPRQGVA
jgi:dipeptide transport system ATP-binding protein